jgi:hypothetical protein
MPETIKFEDVDWAVKLGNYLTRRLLVGCGEHVSENDVEARAKRVLRMIPAKGITARRLGRQTQWLRSRERDEILRDLMGSGLIEQEVVPGERRPVTVFKRIASR